MSNRLRSELGVTPAADSYDLLRTPVSQPQTVLMPAQRLSKGKAIKEQLDLSHVILPSLLRPRGLPAT